MSRGSLAERMQRLGELATRLETLDSEGAVYDFAIDATDAVIPFDAAIVCTVEDGSFFPRAVSVPDIMPGPPLGAGEGIAGQTYHQQRPLLVRNEDPTSPFGATVSLPLEDEGVIQFHARDPDAFSPADKQLGELLAANLSNALGRVRSEATLEQERDEFAALFENVPDAAVKYSIKDGDQIVEAVNSAFLCTFGYQAEDVIGRRLLDLVDGDSAADDHLPEAMLTKATDVEVTREAVDGKRPFLLRNVPIHTSDDGPGGYLIYTDLSEQKERERELERKNERLDDFASILAHDLRNPLNVAQLSVQYERSESESEHLDRAGDALDRVEQLIDDVLTLTRSERGFEVSPDVNLELVAQEAWDTVDTADARFEVEDHVVCTGNETQLKRLFENLFRNAIEHGGEAVTVRLVQTRSGFAIEDDGQGIPPTEHEDIFQAGYSTGATGTGLGLAIVRQIAVAHGWTVSVSTGRMGGARFEFAFEDAQDDSQSARDEAELESDWLRPSRT